MLSHETESSPYRFSSEWTRRLESEIHWRLYWRQQRLMSGLLGPGDEVLEIGVGTGFTANYLRSRGVAVRTLDIDAEKAPDILANVADYAFSETYDAILAFEIFEHIPFEDFRALLPRITRSARRRVFVSLPRNRRLVASVRVKLPKVRARTLSLKVKRRRIDERFHHWELDYGGFSVAALEREFGDADLRVDRRDEAFDRVLYALVPDTVRTTIAAPPVQGLQ